MSSHTHTMINPFDGAILTAAGIGSFFLGLVAGNSPVVAAVASAIVMGIFALIAKGMELLYRWKRDKRIAELEAQIETKAVTKAELNRTI